MTMRLAPLADFLNLDGVRHLAAGGESPSLRSQGEALRRYYEVKGRSSIGMPGRGLKQETYDRCKASAAALLGVGADDVAFVSSAAAGASQVALSLPWRPGDVVIVEDVEFLSSLLPWTRLGERGVEVRVVRHADWTPDETHLAAAVDERTRLIAVSQVNYLTGVHRDLPALRALADRVGAWLFVDASHAAGVVPVPAALCDFAVSATYKWLLGTQGVALLSWNRRRVPELEPAIVGWRSVEGELGMGGDPLSLRWRANAERLEAGNPPWLPIFYLDEGLRYLLDLGSDRIAAYAAALTARLYAGCARLGLPLATPAEAEFRAGMVCFWCEEPEAVASRLAEEGIIVSGYGGRIRISCFIWNDEADIDACLEALPRALLLPVGVAS